MTNTQMFTEERMYHIRVKGELDAQWSDWFEGFVMASRENGSTLLSGTVADQAALHGVLDKLHSLGLPLLLVYRPAVLAASRNVYATGIVENVWRIMPIPADYRFASKRGHAGTKFARHSLRSNRISL